MRALREGVLASQATDRCTDLSASPCPGVHPYPKLFSLNLKPGWLDGGAFVFSQNHPPFEKQSTWGWEVTGSQNACPEGKRKPSISTSTHFGEDLVSRPRLQIPERYEA